MIEDIDQSKWYETNFNRLRLYYPDVSYDWLGCTWFKVPHFPLPENWWQIDTSLLVILPGLEGDLTFQKPDEFYLSKGLCTISGYFPGHVFESGDYNHFRYKKWARYSFHIKQWQPTADGVSGDNLISLLGAVYLSLALLAEETECRRG